MGWSEGSTKLFLKDLRKNISLSLAVNDNEVVLKECAIRPIVGEGQKEEPGH